MSPVVDNPVIVPDASLKRRRSSASQNLVASVAPSAAGHPARKTTGSGHAGMSGTPSTPEESALPVFISGLKRSTSRAVVGHDLLNSPVAWGRIRAVVRLAEIVMQIKVDPSVIGQTKWYEPRLRWKRDRDVAICVRPCPVLQSILEQAKSVWWSQFRLSPQHKVRASPFACRQPC